MADQLQDKILQIVAAGGPLHYRAALLNNLWLYQNDTDGVTPEVDAACVRISALLLDHAERTDGIELAETVIAITEMSLRGYISPGERTHAYRRLADSADDSWQTAHARLRIYLSEGWLLQNEYIDGQTYYATALCDWQLSQQSDGSWPDITDAEAHSRIDILSRLNDTTPRAPRMAILRSARAHYPTTDYTDYTELEEYEEQLRHSSL